VEILAKPLPPRIINIDSFVAENGTQKGRRTKSKFDLLLKHDFVCSDLPKSFLVGE
jgi:hypothetical protein